MTKTAEEKALQKGANIERGAMRKKIKAMRQRFNRHPCTTTDTFVGACLEMWGFLRYREPRTRKKKGGI